MSKQKIGRGGMGGVYRSRDPKFGRIAQTT